VIDRVRMGRCRSPTGPIGCLLQCKPADTVMDVGNPKDFFRDFKHQKVILLKVAGEGGRHGDAQRFLQRDES